MRSNRHPQRKIKVLHLCDKLAVDGGVAGIARSLLLELPRYSSRFEPVVYTLRTEDPGCRLLKNQGIAVTSMGRGKFDPMALVDVLQVVKREQPALIHTHGFAASNFGRLVAWFTQTPIIVEENFCFNIPLYQRIADRLLSPLAVRGVAVSEATKAFMVHRRFFEANRVNVVYRGIVLEDGATDGRGSTGGHSIKDAYGIPNDHRIVSVVGRLHHVKGQDVVLRAIPEVVRRFSRVTFLFIGEGAERPRFEALARNLDIDAHVRFPGFTAKIDPVFAQTDILLVPSLSEAFGRVAIEGMYWGCAVIASRVEGLLEICHDGDDALLITPGDPHDLAEKLITLLGDEGLRARLAWHARENAKRFSIEETVRHFERIYDEIL